MPFRLASSAVDQNGFMPCWYSRSGGDSSPPLGWTGAPKGTRSLAVVCESQGREPRCHWVLFDLPSSPPVVSGGLPKSAELENGARQGTNSFGVTGWTGPDDCSGNAVLTFTAYALSDFLALSPGSSPDEVMAAVEPIVLGTARFTGSYLSRSPVV
jgi:Raf kinase inhibitor-like YbhB/YbcL family protein